MAKSGRSGPPARPPKGPSRGGRPPASPPARSPAPPRSAGAKPTSAPKQAPAAPAAAGPVAATPRLKQAGKLKDPGRPDRAPKIDVAKKPLVKRAMDWLLEDPSKKKRKAKSERDKALVAAATATPRPSSSTPSDEKGKRKLLPLATFFDRGEVLQFGDRSAAKPKTPKPPKQPGPIARTIHKVLGETHKVDEDGERVIVPPAKTDWRWRFQRFFRSNVRGVAYLRTFLVLALVLGTAWTSVYSTTGYDLTDVALAPTDPNDPVSNHKLPFFIIESGSMMRPDSPYGRVGTVDPGDLVVIEKVKDRGDIATFYGKKDQHIAGGRGDVIVFIPLISGFDDPPPVIHRAMAFIELSMVPITNPRFGEPGQAPIVEVPRFTVEEFGIVNAPSITIPELGLVNYAPRHGGFITRGDNPRSNTWSDQALGVTSYPVPMDRVVGKLRYEVPLVGLAKIALSGQDPSLISPDEDWCTFLAGQAACDTWQVFLVLTALFVGLPLCIAVFVYGRRALRRYQERAALQRWQDEEAARLATLREGGRGDSEAPSLPIHDATDLLSGKVAVQVGPPRGQPADWASLTGPARVRLDD